MTNQSSITLDEFKEQIIKHIKSTVPSSNVAKNDIIVKVKLSEDSEPVNFHSLFIVVNM